MEPIAHVNKKERGNSYMKQTLIFKGIKHLFSVSSNTYWYIN